MMKIKFLKRTCIACPSQWEGKLSDGREIYIRFRWGKLTVNVGKDLTDAINNRPILEESTDNEWEGFLSNKHIIDKLHNFGITFSKNVLQNMIDTNQDNLNFDFNSKNFELLKSIIAKKNLKLIN